jgi:predicted Zn-dependent protease
MWKQLSKKLTKKSRLSRNNWHYLLLSGLTALGLVLANPTLTYGVSLQDLLLQGVQLIQLSNISNEQEIRLGKQMNRQLVRSGQIKVYDNPPVERYVRRIGHRLAKTSARPDIPYTFQIVDDNNINAFATMGGFVYVHTGLLRAAENEAELASVIAHEIGHIAASHALKQMRERAITRGLLGAAGLDESTVVQLGVQVALELPNSREDELEADQLGLANVIKAGYAPGGMVSFMRKLQQQSGGSPPTFLSTHPNPGDRVVILEKQIDPRKVNQGDGLDSQLYERKMRSLL